MFRAISGEEIGYVIVLLTVLALMPVAVERFAKIFVPARAARIAFVVIARASFVISYGVFVWAVANVDGERGFDVGDGQRLGLCAWWSQARFIFSDLVGGRDGVGASCGVVVCVDRRWGDDDQNCDDARAHAVVTLDSVGNHSPPRLPPL